MATPQEADRKIKLTPDNQSLGLVNADELLDVQCQIAENALGGYYIKYDNKNITISPKGELSEWPRNMLDHQQQLSAKLYTIRKNKYGHY